MGDRFAMSVTFFFVTFFLVPSAATGADSTAFSNFDMSSSSDDSSVI